MPNLILYHKWFRKLRELREGEHKARLKSFTWLMVGIYFSGSVHLSKVACETVGEAVNNSKARRLARVLGNNHIRVREWYDPTAQSILENIADSGQEIRLIADGSKVGFGHQLLMVSVAYRRRSIPIVWTWVKGKRGHSSAHKQMALLAHARSLIPEGATVSLAGDSEFGAIPIVELLEEWEWLYTLRQKGSHQVQLSDQETWRRFDELVSKGESRWFADARLTKAHAHKTNLVAHWEKGEKEPWLLATNRPTKRIALRAYRKRAWIEEMFGDFKKHGFDLESTHLRHFLRLSRLTLAVVLIYLWLVAFGSSIIKRGLRRLVDRNDRRDLSIFRIGYDSMKRRLNNQQSFKLRLMPYF